MDKLEQAESHLWQIVRMHNDDIKVRFKVTPDFGTVFYWATLKVCGKKKMYGGRNLYKRYLEMKKDLERIYGDNLYIYGAKPLKNL